MNLHKLHMAGKRGAALFFALILTASALFALEGCKKKPEDGSPVPVPDSQSSTTKKQEILFAPNPLTGLPLNRADAQGKRPYAVMVNNAPPARPQWGLGSADVVIEGMVEGGITRMLWLFADSKDMPKIGPVRSARHDFVELAEGLDAIYVHWGESPQADSALKNRKVNHVDGYVYSGKYFLRDNSRKVAVEHRGYTSGALIEKAIKALQYRTDYDAAYKTPFQFTETLRVLQGAAAKKVGYQFSGSYRYQFEYQESDQLYYQSLNEKPFEDDKGKQRAVTNITLLYVPVSQISGDKKGRVDMRLTSGDGLYISGGRQEAITWEKGKPADMLKLFGADGKPLTLNKGKGYIGLVPVSQKGKTVIA